VVGDFSLGSRSFLQGTEGVLGVLGGCTRLARLAFGEVDLTCAANPGKGSDMGSVLRR
jgi:hypothetical protein